jgi:hypothetical protein
MKKHPNKKRVLRNYGYYPIQVIDGDLLTRIFRWCFECRHDYSTTAINGFAFPSEVKCLKCGMYWHRILKADDLPSRAEWQNGKHPKSTINLATLLRNRTQHH